MAQISVPGGDRVEEEAPKRHQDMLSFLQQTLIEVMRQNYTMIGPLLLTRELQGTITEVSNFTEEETKLCTE